MDGLNRYRSQATAQSFVGMTYLLKPARFSVGMTCFLKPFSKISYRPYVESLVFHGFQNDNAAVLHLQGGSTSCAQFRA